MGYLAQRCSLPAGTGRSVCKHREMDRQIAAGPLARCGHAAARLFGTGAGMGEAETDAALAWRATGVDDAMGDFPFAADGWRRPLAGGRLDQVAADQPRSARYEPAFDGESSSDCDGSGCRA